MKAFFLTTYAYYEFYLVQNILFTSINELNMFAFVF